jgi:hypothetical protein
MVIFLLFWINAIVIWFLGRTFTKLMLFPNSNPLISYFMNQSLYKKVTQELCKLLKYTVNVIEHMREGREFENEREYEKYVQDLVKGMEMLNLLLEANLHYKTQKGNNISQLFIDLTSSMVAIRDGLKSVKVYNTNDRNEKQTNSFFSYDFGFPIFDPRFHPLLPEFVDTKENKELLAEVKTQIGVFVELCSDNIIKKR